VEAALVEFAPGSLEALDQTIPTKNDLTYSLPQTVTYDGDSHAVTVTKKISEMGAVTVFYEGTGTTTYAKSATAPVNAGTYQVTADVAANGIYGQALGLELGILTISKAPTPSITWPVASGITYGQTLSASTLTPASNSYGSFAWDPATDPATTKPNAGSPAYAVVFTPSAATINNYEAFDPADLTREITVAVSKAAAPSITWPVASEMVGGRALSTSELTGGSTDLGSFAWTDATIVPPVGGGSYNVTFTPSAATLNNYEAINPDDLTKDISVAVRMVGDLDNDGYTTAFDVLYYLLSLTGNRPALTGVAAQAADLDGDGNLTAADALLMLKKAAGIL
jgi:hypothetical protein